MRCWRRWTLALAALPLLAGCEGLSEAVPPSETAVPSPTPRPATGSTFTTAVPLGWVNHLSDPAAVLQYKAGGDPIMLVEKAPSGDVRPNINDVPSSLAVVRLRDRLPDEKVVNYLKTFPYTTLKAPPRHYSLGEDEGVAVLYTGAPHGTPLENLDMVVSHHGASHEVIFSATVAGFDSVLPEAEVMLDSWSWKDGP